MSGEQSNDWRRALERDAMQFSAVTVQNFRLCVSRDIRHLAIDTNESRAEVVTAYMNSLASTFAALASEVMGSPALATEEHAVTVLRDKFRTIRQNILVKATTQGANQ